MRALFGLYMVSMIIYFPCYHFEYVFMHVYYPLSFAHFFAFWFNLIAQIIDSFKY